MDTLPTSQPVICSGAKRETRRKRERRGEGRNETKEREGSKSRQQEKKGGGGGERTMSKSIRYNTRQERNEISGESRKSKWKVKEE